MDTIGLVFLGVFLDATFEVSYMARWTSMCKPNDHRG